MRKRISELAEKVFAGVPSAGRTPLGKGEYKVKVINIKDLVDGVVDTANLAEEVVESLDKVNQFMVKEGDVIITARGTVIKSAVATKECEGCLISGNLIAIRLRPGAEIHPHVLQAYFESKLGQKNIQSISRSSAFMLSLTKSSVMELEIPIPNKDDHDNLVKLTKLRNEYFKAAKEAMNLRQMLIQETINKLFV
ncbi:Type I restriction modification DNA specificity domain-containing protein (plasmid) [Carboxydocella thermautotrophica]|nr:Type I restriction modification DNA specificity domain-containing protein [Carboxydocella thermautotrophica]